MRLRQCGTFQYKGSVGLYLEAVDIPADQPRYAAVDDGAMDETASRRLDAGEIVESPILDLDPAGWLHRRIDDCLR